ncbi:MAG: hypothetical protein AAF264_13845 [Pseudomonadota bacterium]
MDNPSRPIGTLETTAICAGVAALAGFGAFALLLLLGGWSFLQGAFGGIVVAAILLPLLSLTVGRPKAQPAGAQDPTADVAAREAPGTPGQPAEPHLAPRDLNAPSPHKDGVDVSVISDTRHESMNDPTVNKAISPGPDGTPRIETAPATRIPSPAPINAADAAVARPVGATTNPSPQAQPAPLDGAVISPEPPADSADRPRMTRNEAAETGVPRPTPSATHAAQSYNEVDPVDTGASASAKAARAPKAHAAASPKEVAPKAAPAPAAVEPEPKAAGSSVSGTDVPDGQEKKPETLSAPKDGKGDDLKKIKGVGPKLEKLCNEMGFWHYSQIANWSAEEVAWVDQNLVGFKGRVTRDDWVSQAALLASGGETEFSKRVDKGGVY